MKLGLPGVFANIDRVVAVVGCQRSGTTVTAQLLGAAPNALLIDEFDGLYDWFHGHGEAEVSSHEKVLAQAAQKYRSPDRFVGDPTSLRLRHSVTTLVLKAPNLTFDEAALEAFALPVTVVYLVRDPRAVVSSMQKLSTIDFVQNQIRLMRQRPAIAEACRDDLSVMADSSRHSWVRQAALWKVKSGRAGVFRAAALPVYSLHYEDLARDPDLVIEALSRSCRLQSTTAEGAAAAYVGHGPGGTDRTRVVDDTSIDMFKSVLSAAQQSDILEMANPLAQELGYE